MVSTARTFADWGWTEGSATWEATRASVEDSPLPSCSAGNLDLDAPEGPGSWERVEIALSEDGGPTALLYVEGPCAGERANPQDGTTVRITGCGFVSYMWNWSVAVYDANSGCVVGKGSQTDAGSVGVCPGGPEVVGTFPPDCHSEVIEGWCEPVEP